jgi:hypothetical protein
MKRAVLILGLGMGACGGPSAQPPVPPPVPPTTPDEMSHNPPPVEMSHNPPMPLPTWDQVPSGHPEGATNPPSPILIMTDDGACYKKWVGMASAGEKDHRVTTCAPDECGQMIQCPPDAAARVGAPTPPITPPPPPPETQPINANPPRQPVPRPG